MAELYEELNDLIDSDPAIDEIGLIPCEDDHPPFSLADHKLAIAFHAVPRLYAYALERLLERGSDRVRATRTVLLVNADCLTAWNERKRLVAEGALAPADEVRFTALVFSKHPKCVEGWAHRRWAIAKGAPLDPAVELAVATRVAEIYPKNYYAWTHRQWAVARSENVELVLGELDSIRRWIVVNVSDYCGLHHRQFLIRRILALAPISANEVVGREFAFATDLITRYPGHEALWCHRRMVFAIWLEHGTIALGAAFAAALAEDGDQMDATGLSVAAELAFVHLCARERTDADAFEHQKRFALAYRAWILHMLARTIDDAALADDIRTAERRARKEALPGVVF